MLGAESCTLTADFTIHYSILNSGHSETQLNSTKCFLPSLSYSSTVYRTASIGVKLQSLTRNVFNCSLLWKHVLFWLAVWLVAETYLEKPLPSYSRTFRLQYSDFQAARHNIIKSMIVSYCTCAWLGVSPLWYKFSITRPTEKDVNFSKSLTQKLKMLIFLNH
jgi:hypothetical protein